MTHKDMDGAVYANRQQAEAARKESDRLRMPKDVTHEPFPEHTHQQHIPPGLNPELTIYQPDPVIEQQKINYLKNRGLTDVTGR